MNPEILAAVVRHAATALGGAGLATSGADVANGTASSNDDLTALISAIITVIGIAWSIYQKRQAQKKIEAAAKGVGVS